MSGASRTSSVPANSESSSMNRRSSFHSNTLRRKPLARRASISADPASLKENARKRAEEKRLAEIERQKMIRKRNALSRKLDFDPEMMRCSTAVPSSSSGSLNSVTSSGSSQRQRSLVCYMWDLQHAPTI